jgi:ribosome-binding protein aMBF1 (putative translation factor)
MEEPDVLSNVRDKTPQAGAPRRRSRQKTEQPAFPTLEPFARRLENIRLERGLTQCAVAAGAHISTNHYQDIAHANANPTLVVLVELANALTVPLVHLFEPPMLPRRPQARSRSGPQGARRRVHAA